MRVEVSRAWISKIGRSGSVRRSNLGKLDRRNNLTSRYLAGVEDDLMRIHSKRIDIAKLYLEANIWVAPWRTR